jgi:hypothetical protein
MTDWPKFNARRTIELSPWIEIIEREVDLIHKTPSALYTMRKQIWTSSK